MKRALLILLLLFIPFTLIMAKVNFNGAYESSFTFIRDNQEYKWQLASPWHRLELRFYADPIPNTEFFLKTYADSWRTTADSDRKEAFYLDEGHIKYRWGDSDYIESFLFVRETRFWLGDPLLNLVNNDYDKWDDKKVSGLTYEMNGFLPGFWSKFFITKMVDSDIDNAGIRVYEKLLKNNVHIGSTITYKKWQGSKNYYNSVYAGDLWVGIIKKVLNLTGEAGISRTPTLITDKNDVLACKIEVKGDRPLQALLNKNIGSLSYRLGYRDIGNDFRAYLSKDYDNDRKFDQIGYDLNVQYLFPIKAITLKYYRDYYKRHYENYQVNDNQLEAYIEFIKGFRWKNYYQIYHELNTDRIQITQLDGSVIEVNFVDNTWQHYLTQLEMENSIAYVKLQFKIKNIYTEYLKYLYGTEYSINITQKLKSINRLIIIDEGNRARKTFFSQIQYRYGENTDFYLGYGEESDSNDDLVNDDNFVEGDNNIVHKAHLYVKVGF
ncbi:MAG: hypothetical protein KKH98_15425 [Spirochaetes bacterium]|nr:hypothetical protein [Spirochaetota bacterium]